VLPEDADRRLLRMLDLAADLQESRGLRFEVTPPTAEDAYGGWWVSVYDEAGLDRSRATPTELAGITVARKDVKPSGPSPAAGDDIPWTADDLKAARPAATPSGDRVYVHAYTRKDGTYVQGHTRSAPGGGGGRRR
jgi:hypothetical protein